MAPRAAAKKVAQAPKEGAGDRLFLIRLACGESGRPEAIKDFAERVERVTKAHYDPATISRLERGEQRWKLDDVRTFALVDPLKRGANWLAFGAVEAQPLPAGTIKPR